VQRDTSGDERPGMIRLQGQRLVITRQSLVEPLEPVQGEAAIGERLDVTRLQLERVVVTRQSLIVSLQFAQRMPRLTKASALFGRKAMARS